MNIIFSVGYLSSIPFANNNIEILLADTLRDMGHNVYVCGVSYDDNIDYTTPHGTRVFGMGINEFYNRAQKHFSSYLEGIEKKHHPVALKKYILQHPIYSMEVFILSTDLPRKIKKIRFMRWLKKLSKSFKADGIVGFCFPFDMAYRVLSKDWPMTKIYYQFDPHGLHMTYDTENRRRNQDMETRLIAACKKTFTTRVLKNQYDNHEKYAPYAKKTVGVDFPVLIKKPFGGGNIPFDFKEENTNILFCGTMDDGFRSPDYLFEIFEKIFEKDSSVKLYFLGPQNGEKVSLRAKKHPDNIFVHRAVEASVAYDTMAKAHMLINIGNSIANMVPSKIFDYFALGKPVINVQKIENSPDMEYFEKYPLQFTMGEYKKEDCSVKLYDFIQRNKHSSIDFDHVKAIFPGATPEYVAKLIEEALK